MFTLTIKNIKQLNIEKVSILFSLLNFLLPFCSQTNKITATWINSNISNGRKCYMAMIRAVGEVVCLAWLASSVFLWVSWIACCRHQSHNGVWFDLQAPSHAQGQRVWVLLSSDQRKCVCVSQTLPKCSWQLVTFLKCSGSLFHVVAWPSAPSPRNIIHLPTSIVELRSSLFAWKWHVISSCTVRRVQTILGCEIRSLMSLLAH